MMKTFVAAVLGLGLLVSLPSHADNGEVLLGAGLGGAIGAVVGHQIGGHDGAIVGGALGAATGAAIAYDDHGRPIYRERVDYHHYHHHRAPPVRYVIVDDDRHHRHHHRRHHHRHDYGYGRHIDYHGYDRRGPGTVIVVRD
ncbi:MAG: glycine zipper domain-containing protein [Pseudomonadota bacterium]